MHNKRIVYYIFLPLFLFIIFDKTAQTMDVLVNQDDDEQGRLLTSNTHNLSAKQKLWETINLHQERDESESDSSEFVQGSDLDPSSDLGSSHGLQDVIQLDSSRAILQSSLINQIQTEETNTRLTPKNCQETVATTITLSTMLLSALTYSGFGNLTFFFFMNGITPANRTHLSEPTNDPSPSHSLRPATVDPNHTIQTILLAIPPTLTQALLIYHGTNWFIIYASKLKKRTFSIDSLCQRCFCEPKGFRKAVLDIAYSRIIRAFETVVYGGFIFNMVASLVSHTKGFGGGDEWSIVLGLFALPMPIYTIGCLYTNSKNSPLYPRTEPQEDVLEELSIIQYAAENESITDNNALSEYNNSLENDSIFTLEKKDTIRGNLSKATFQKYPKLWNKSKETLALSYGLGIQGVNCFLNGWVVYSLTNKLCWIADQPVASAHTYAAATTAGFALPLMFGAVRGVEASYHTAKLFLNGFRPEVSGYWGQRIPPILAVGCYVLYNVIPFSFSFEREIMFNPYGGTCTKDSNTNCTGSYYGNLETTSRFAVASFFAAGSLLSAGINWFLDPIEQTAHWAVHKFANLFDRGEPTPTYSKKQLMALNLAKKLRNYKFLTENWEDDFKAD